jgi:hypothetical protein
VTTTAAAARTIPPRVCLDRHDATDGEELLLLAVRDLALHTAHRRDMVYSFRRRNPG